MLNEECIKWNFPVNIDKEQWFSLLKDQDTVKPQDLELLIMIYTSEGYMATAFTNSKTVKYESLRAIK